MADRPHQDVKIQTTVHDHHEPKDSIRERPVSVNVEIAEGVIQLSVPGKGVGGVAARLVVTVDKGDLVFYVHDNNMCQTEPPYKPNRRLLIPNVGKNLR